MIGKNLLTNREEIPLNRSKVTWIDVVANGTKVRIINKETSITLVTKDKNDGSRK